MVRVALGPGGTRPFAGSQLPDCFSVATPTQWARSHLLTHVEPQVKREEASSFVFMGQRDVNPPSSGATAGMSRHQCWAVAGGQAVKGSGSLPRRGTGGWLLVAGEFPAILGPRVLGLRPQTYHPPAGHVPMSPSPAPWAPLRPFSPGPCALSQHLRKTPTV